MQMLTVLMALLGAALGQLDQCDRDKTWLLTIEHSWGSYSYSDSVTGYYDGFSEEITRLVCEAAGVKCEIMYDSWKTCVGTDSAGRPVLGSSLKTRAVDACIQASPTVERIHFASFSEPYAEGLPRYFYKKGDAPDATDFTTAKVGFVNGWSTNLQCLNRCFAGYPGIPLKADDAVFVDKPEELIAKLEDGTVDYFMSSASDIEKKLENYAAKPQKKCPCQLGDVSVMERKDTHFKEVWNFGLSKVLLNGQYQQLCDKYGPTSAIAQKDMNGRVLCFPGYNISDYRVYSRWLKK